uniref:Uncharacterized protein n=1 Tax=Anguilla anguilla TaxID=7936 RepID=A0A0E9SYN7_ANGAN
MTKRSLVDSCQCPCFFLNTTWLPNHVNLYHLNFNSFKGDQFVHSWCMTINIYTCNKSTK